MFKKNKGLYTDEDFELEENTTEYVVEDKEIKARKTMNIFFCIIIAIIVLVVIDIIFVTKLSIGPFFAIRTKVYNDGGTKEYYGIGYKVIKYNQKQGRRDTVLGTWNMPYAAKPVDTDIVDLAIEFQTNAQKTYSKFAGQFIRTSGTITKLNKKNNTVTIEYKDDGGKYTLAVNCILSKDDKKITSFKKNYEVTIIGTVSSFEVKTNKKPNTLTIKNCFISK